MYSRTHSFIGELTRDQVLLFFLGKQRQAPSLPSGSSHSSRGPSQTSRATGEMGAGTQEAPSPHVQCCWLSWQDGQGRWHSQEGDRWEECLPSGRGPSHHIACPTGEVMKDSPVRVGRPFTKIFTFKPNFCPPLSNFSVQITWSDHSKFSGATWGL